MKPGEEPLHEPAVLIPPQMPTVLGLELAVGAMRGNHIHPVLLELRIELIAVIGTITDEMLRLSLEHVEIETELHQRDLMMIGRMRTHGQGEPMPIDNRENFHTFTAFRKAHGLTTAFGRGKRHIDEALAFIKRDFITESIRELRQNISQHLAFASLLKSTMHRFVVEIALRKQVPLRTGVQNPQHGFQHSSCRHGLAARSVLRNVFFGEMSPNPIPLVIAQPQHAAEL